MDNIGVQSYRRWDKSKKRSSDENDEERDSIYAKIALEYYNKENGTNYELDSAVLLSSEFISDGTWVHCNFAARKPNDKSSRMIFFAEMQGDDSPMTVTCCVVLEGGDLTSGCSLCSDVIHPSYGFLQGHHEPKFSFHPTTSLQPTSNQPTTFSYQQRPWYMPTPEELKPFQDELMQTMKFLRPCFAMTCYLMVAGIMSTLRPSQLMRIPPPSFSLRRFIVEILMLSLLVICWKKARLLMAANGSLMVAIPHTDLVAKFARIPLSLLNSSP